MKQRLLSVLTADVIGSREHLSKNPRLFHSAIDRCLKAVNARCGSRLALPFEVTVGDEIQGVVAPHWEAPEVVEQVRYLFYLAHPALPVRLNIGVGVAGGSISGKKSSRLQNGPAFHLSRSGIEGLKGDPSRVTKIVTIDNGLNEEIDLILGYQDLLRGRWTLAQWEAVRLRSQGLGLEEVGRQLKIAYQSAQKRLRAAHWDQYQRGVCFLKTLLRRTPLQG